MTRRPKFIVWAPSYDENVGGVIVLHELCSRLNELGYEAKLWPPFRDIPLDGAPPGRVRGLIDRLYGWLTYRKGPDRNSFARRRDLASAIVIYPETVTGNPVGASRVVRWILYHPGGHGGPTTFDADDLLVPFSREFLANGVVETQEPPLRVTRRNPAYSRTNDGPRSGSCVLVYKGKDRTLDAHPEDAVPVDALDHAGRAAVFNRCERLYSYDPYTMTNIYAALCGCIPIVVPVDGMSKEQWYDDERLRYGIAYGEGGIDWAIATRGKMLDHLAEARAEENESVRRFAERCIEVFSFDH